MARLFPTGFVIDFVRRRGLVETKAYVRGRDAYRATKARYHNIYSWSDECLCVHVCDPRRDAAIFAALFSREDENLPKNISCI